MKRVLLAVNNIVIKRSVRDIMVHCGFQIASEANNAADALRKARSMLVDLVIMDAQLEGGRVGQTAMVLEEDGIAPVLILAGENDPLTREYAYVLKPFLEGALVPAVHSTLRQYEKQQNLMKQVQDLKNQISTRKVVDIAKGLIMKQQDVTEEEAHKMLQRISMEKGMPLKAVAQAFIDSQNAGN